jgi:hypothetical protein
MKTCFPDIKLAMKRLEEIERLLTDESFRTSVSEVKNPVKIIETPMDSSLRSE